MEKKEYKNSDILLYSVQKGNIVVIYDDVEKLNAYMNSKEADSYKYAPVKAMAYTKELEKQILKEMHHMVSYKPILLPGCPEIKRDMTEEEVNQVIEARKNFTLYEITYNDGAGDFVYPIKFSGHNKDTIQKILNEQKNLRFAINIEEFNNLPEEEKTAKKAGKKDIWKKTVAAALATLIIAGGIHHSKDIKKISAKVFDENEIGVEDTVATPTPTPIKITESQVNEFAKKLYEETITKDSFILKYQQEAQVNWSEDLAHCVIELENGIYPTAFKDLSEEQQEKEMFQLIQAILLIAAGNDYFETKTENVINLGDYVINPIDKAIINNTIMLSRQVICESIGESFTPNIIEDYQQIEVFQREYKTALEQLLDYQDATAKSAEFLDASNGVKLMTTCLFRTINDKIPQYAHVHNTSPEFKETNYELYYRYFKNNDTGEIYYPRRQTVINNKAEENMEEYILTYTDSTGTHEKVYTRSEMFALDGADDYYQDQYTNRDTGVTPETGICQQGLEVRIGRIYNLAIADLLDKQYDESKNWDGLLAFEEKQESEDKTNEETKKGDNPLITGLAIGLGATGVGYATYTASKKKEEESKVR